MTALHQHSQNPVSNHSLLVNIRRVLRRVITPIWPRRCSLCDTDLDSREDIVCLNCLAKIPRFRFNSTINFVGAPANTIELRSWFVYDRHDETHTLIHQIKYHDRYYLARKLGREFALQKLMDGFTADLILPIPLHWSKFLKRGYNQSQRIALGIKDITGIPVKKNLYACKTHDTQTHNNRQERLNNVAGIFAVRQPSELDNKHIALLDDVFTTGATMISALEAILKVSKPASVTFLTLAKTGKYPQ